MIKEHSHNHKLVASLSTRTNGTDFRSIDGRSELHSCPRKHDVKVSLSLVSSVHGLAMQSFSAAMSYSPQRTVQSENRCIQSENCRKYDGYEPVLVHRCNVMTPRYLGNYLGTDGSPYGTLPATRPSSR